MGRTPANFSCFVEDTSSKLAAGLEEEGFGSLSRQRFYNEQNPDTFEEAAPTLTLASSLKDSSGVSRGFNISK